MNFIRNQTQKSGDGCTNIQAETINLHQTILTYDKNSNNLNYLTNKRELNEIILKEVIDLKSEPHFYFWRSEGKSSIEVLNLCRSILKKREDRNSLNNLTYYYGLHYLQIGEYMKAKKYLKHFMQFIKEKKEKQYIYWTAGIHYGKSLFYLREYQKAYQLWEHIRKKIKVIFPSGHTLNYYDASMTWREYLIEKCLVSDFDERSIDRKYKDLIEITSKVGSHQLKNLWFSQAISEYLNKNFEDCIYSLEKLKILLKDEFNQPMFMITALLLEARALNNLGGQTEKYHSSIILESLNNLQINWNSQLFVNQLCGNSYSSLYSKVKNSNQYKEIIDDSKKHIRTDDCFMYIYKNLTIDKILR